MGHGHPRPSYASSKEKGEGDLDFLLSFLLVFLKTQRQEYTDISTCLQVVEVL
ncbi:unnamed protein product [Brassica rapa subsp. narinosa]